MAVHSARVDVAIGDVTSAPFSGVECAWNEYQNEYQTDSCRYVQMRTDTHGLTFEMRQKVSKIGLKRAIPTLASSLLLGFLEENGPSFSEIFSETAARLVVG